MTPVAAAVGSCVDHVHHGVREYSSTNDVHARVYRIGASILPLPAADTSRMGGVE